MKPLLPTTSTSELSFEWAPRLEKRKGLMVPLSSIENFSRQADAGFRSVYLFTAEDAERIKASHSSKGFGGLNVWSNCLFIDIDGGDEGLRRCLEQMPFVGYELYSSGSKGYHIHIPHLPYSGCIPEAHREWVEHYGLPFDRSIYGRHSIIALPGRVHPKTKQKKRLLMVVDGPEPEFWQPVLKAPVAVLEPISETAETLLKAARLVESMPGLGGRHTALWSLAKSFHDAGFTYNTALELVEKVNISWASPKDEEEVVRAVSQAFR